MAIIEDAEMRALYASECEEHLQALDEGLLQLENAPGSSALNAETLNAETSDQNASDKIQTIEAIFRAAHSLKGSSRMVGASGAEAIAHALEDALGDAKRGRTQLSPDDLDRLGIGLRALRALVAEAVGGTPANLNISQVLREIDGDKNNNDATQHFFPAAPATLSTRNQEKQQSETVPERISRTVERMALDENLSAVSSTSRLAAADFATTELTDSNSAMSPSLALRDETFGRTSSQLLATREKAPLQEISDQKAPEPKTSATKDEFKIQTMRVPPARLDALMTLASELAVTTSRVSRGLAALSEIGELCERWQLDLAQRQRRLMRASATSAREVTALREEEARLARLQELWLGFRAVVPKNAVRLSAVAEDIEESIRNVRLLPLSTVFGLFPRLVRDLARAQGKDVQFVIEGGDTPADKRVLEDIKDPLMHMLRNSVDHGIETPDARAQSGKSPAAILRLRASRGASGISIELSDDGRGLDEDAIARVAFQRGLHSREELDAMTHEQIQNLIFAPGFSTSATVTDVSGRGVGMDVVRHNIENLKGSLTLQSRRGRGCTFTIRLPLTLATTRVLLVEVRGASGLQIFALPVEAVQSLVRLRQEQIFLSEGRAMWVQNDEAIPLFSLAQLLELAAPATSFALAARPTNLLQSSTRSGALSCVILSVDGEKIGLEVEQFLDEQDVVFKALGALLHRVRNVAGTTILGGGEVCLVLNATDLMRSARSFKARALAPGKALSSDTFPRETEEQAKAILLVEDSLLTRTLEKRILESAGYDVTTAFDGVDALTKMASRTFDAVVSDVQMPNMDGLALTAKIRQDARLREMPILLVTSMSSDDDKRRGMEVGADAYLIKSAFEHRTLLDALARLIP